MRIEYSHVDLKRGMYVEMMKGCCSGHAYWSGMATAGQRVNVSCWPVAAERVVSPAPSNRLDTVHISNFTRKFDIVVVFVKCFQKVCSFTGKCFKFIRLK